MEPVHICYVDPRRPRMSTRSFLAPKKVSVSGRVNSKLTNLQGEQFFGFGAMPEHFRGALTVRMLPDSIPKRTVAV